MRSNSTLNGLSRMILLKRLKELITRKTQIYAIPKMKTCLMKKMQATEVARVKQDLEISVYHGIIKLQKTMIKVFNTRLTDHIVIAEILI